MSTFFKSSSIYVFSSILASAIPFLLIPIMTRYLTQEEYGQIAMFQILVTALSAVVGLSVHSAANRKFFDKDVSSETLRKFNGACMQILFCSASVALLTALLFGGWMAKQLNIPSTWIVLALIVATAGFISQIRLGQWQIRNKAKRFGTFQVLQSLCNALISILLVVSLLQGAQGRIDAQVGVSLVFSALALSFLYRDRLLKFFHWDVSMLKEALAFGGPMIPHVVGGFLLLSIDRFVINSELGIASVGIYMVAIQLSSALKIIFHSLNKAYMPWLFGQLKIDNTQTKVKIVKLTYLYYVALVLLSGIIFLIGPFFVTLIAGEQYKDAGSVIGLLCLGNIFNGMYLMITNYIFYSKKTFWLSIVTILSGTINIGLLFLLIEPFGLVGAGIAYAVSNFIMFLLAWFVSNKAYSMPWFDRKLFT